MQKNPLIITSIGLISVIVLASFTNVIGYQTVRSSNQIITNNDIDQKELLFQTLVDMANNKEIQKVILASEITEESLLEPNMKYSISSFPVLTEKFLKQAYAIGLMLIKFISKSKIRSLLERYQTINQSVQKKISNVIEKDVTLKGEKIQLLNSKCDCEKDNTDAWNFPILCAILYPIAFFMAMLWYFSLIIFYHVPHSIQILFDTIKNIGTTLDCFWMH